MTELPQSKNRRTGLERARPWLTAGMIVGLAAGALIPETQRAREVWRWARRAELVTDQERRWAPLRARAPRDQLLGYVTDLRYPAPFFDFDTYTHFYWAQYALAPALLVQSPSREYLVGDFRDAALAIPWKARLEVIAEGPRGTVLLRRREP